MLDFDLNRMLLKKMLNFRIVRKQGFEDLESEYKHKRISTGLYLGENFIAT